MTTQQCSVCDAEFDCGASNEDQACWCIAHPPVMPADFMQDCRCRSCLAQAIDRQISDSITQRGIEQMIELARPYRTGGELSEGIDYTIERGNYVFSRWYHLKRGSCCDNGCRNCPYADGARP